jgi:hypothetical protein
MKDNQNPLEQIHKKRYYVKYQEKQNQQIPHKNIYLVGVEFDETERNITSFEWEKI